MKVKINAQHKDDRGEISDLLVKEAIDAITRITFEPGAVRANHYHKLTTQWTYVTSGKIVYASSSLNAEDEGDSIEEILIPGEMVVSRPNEVHAFKAIDRSEILVFTKGPRAGYDYELDTFRLETPILK